MSDDDQPTLPLGSTPSSPTEPLDHPTLPLASPTEPLFAASPAEPTPETIRAQEQADTPPAPAPLAPRPRTRWAAVVWGALFAAFGVVVMSVLSNAANRAAYADWVTGLGPSGSTLLGIAALGALLLVLGVVAAANRASRRSL
ncbi:hypothetical protein [Frondihabitans australicus]|uniref:Uncharacterized protein n=1 Tax=Frondihabitans australicus TaxID=386892 RepID=A0A495IJ94_9MICO|nr:hypothetical protein [Frondihabitans australicus]RKR75780.1 hypothetical protein C8E83_2936 [Frondihabitans australicus]